MNIQERLTAFAMLGAGWVMWLLVGLSVVGLAIVIERGYFFLTTRDDIRKLRDEFAKALRAGDLAAAHRRFSESRSIEARILVAGIDAAPGGPRAAEERMAGESQLARLHLERNIAFLGTVGNNAPFVGLLGTVIGVIRAFHELESSAGQVTSGLMTEVGEALVATAIGILVALPAVAFFNIFQRAVKNRLARGDSLGRDLLSYLEAHIGRPAVAKD